MPKEVKVYTTQYCPYCTRAKNLLKSRNIPFQEIDLSNDPEKREKLSSETGWMTVPMIFIGQEFIGGSDDLHRIAENGQLDAKLNS